MAAVDGRSGDTPRQARGSPANCTPDLTEEHGQLLRQVAVRADELMAAVRADRWPARELEALLGYLHTEIVRQTVDEETLLFPVRDDVSGLGRLARDHARLRADVEALDLMAADGGGSLAMLATAVRDLLSQLESHLAAEEAILGAAGGGRRDVPATTALGAHPHEWYPLTEGRIIELDALPPAQVADAAAERLLRLGRGEDVELRSHRDPFPVWQRVDELAPGHYGFVYLEDGPDHWRVLVTRRKQA
ncbi:MAG TPA: hemerythrin domain-containing protein [Streptosporangiaceae bacterium]|nr:hemerythrin domain-containing protein [Streptosporangiaceae bacterium]